MPLPTATEFKVRFPEYASLDDGLVSLGLDHASLFVDDRLWASRDVPVAILYLAAHLLARSLSAAEGVSGGEGEEGSTAETFVKSVSFGDRTVSWGQVNAAMTSGAASMAGSSSALSTSSYGKFFLMLRSRNIFTGVVV